MPQLDKDLRKIADNARAKSGAKVTITEDGTVSGPPDEYFKFLYALKENGKVIKPEADLISLLACQSAQEYLAIKVEGLSYWQDFVTADEEKSLMAAIDAQPWLTDLKRRVQHYGYKYDYKARAVSNDSYLGPLPDWLQALCHRLHEKNVFAAPPDQVIVNEYMPGQGISPHVDCVPCFGGTIASLSLGSACGMVFSHPQTGQEKGAYLEPRGLIVLTGPARYEWEHSIPARKTDDLWGKKVKRERRVSLTFRTVINS